MKRVIVRAPMSSANLGPGFDVLAVAFDAFYDVLELRVVGEGVRRVSVRVSGAYSSSIPQGSGNVVLGPILRALEASGEKLEVEAILDKGVPPGRGLGSSGASSAAAAFAINELLGGVFDDDELVYIAGEGERIASGEPHYDNVSASILGGFVIVSPGDRVRVHRILGGDAFRFLLAIPEIETPEKKTGVARSVIPRQISLRDHVISSSNLAKLIYRIATNNPAVAGEGMVDQIVENARASAGLIPLYREIREKALELGAYGVCVSGAGPSILILANEDLHDKIGKEIQVIYSSRGIKAKIISTRPAEGAKNIA
jgi:homoserine kinase